MIVNLHRAIRRLVPDSITIVVDSIRRAWHFRAIGNDVAPSPELDVPRLDIGAGRPYPHVRKDVHVGHVLLEERTRDHRGHSQVDRVGAETIHGDIHPLQRRVGRGLQFEVVGHPVITEGIQIGLGKIRDVPRPTVGAKVARCGNGQFVENGVVVRFRYQIEDAVGGAIKRHVLQARIIDRQDLRVRKRGIPNTDIVDCARPSTHCR